MKRRVFITLLGSAALCWPLAARAQPHVARIGFMGNSTAALEANLVDAFRCAERHAAKDTRSPRVLRSKPMLWYTTFRRFQPWTTIMGSVYLFGHLRKASAKRLVNASDHPRMAT